MRGIEIFQKPSYREISPMRDRPMRGPPVLVNFFARNEKLTPLYFKKTWKKVG